MRILLALPLLAGFALAQGGGPRDLWSRIERFDRDGDGKVTREEFRGPQRFFDRLDADRDGAITRDEAQGLGGRRGGRGGRRPGGADVVGMRVDADKDGTVSLKEWSDFFAAADENGDEILDPEELRAALSGRAVRDPAPEVGDEAPEVSATDAATGEPVDLASVRRPTVLIFGSYT